MTDLINLHAVNNKSTPLGNASARLNIMQCESSLNEESKVSRCNSKTSSRNSIDRRLSGDALQLRRIKRRLFLELVNEEEQKQLKRSLSLSSVASNLSVRFEAEELSESSASLVSRPSSDDDNFED